jgi:iron complex transport system substrate-binding protein
MQLEPARDDHLQEVPVGTRFRFPPLAVLLPAIFVATGPTAAAQSFPLRVNDDTGAAVTLAAPPVRIVSLTLATDEMLFSMVDPKRIVAVTNLAPDPSISNVADLAATIPNKLAVNVETILSLSPDLVLVANWTDPGPVQQLRQAGVPVYLMASGITVASIEGKIERLAELCGEPARGRQMVAQMEARLQAVAGRVAGVPREKRPRVIDYGSWGGAMGRGSSWQEMLDRAGLRNGVAELSADEWGQVPLSREKLLELDPDILILPGWLYTNPAGAARFYAQVTEDPALRGLRAVKSGRVYQMPERLQSTTSQYFVEAVEWLARTAYPELFR